MVAMIAEVVVVAAAAAAKGCLDSTVL